MDEPPSDVFTLYRSPGEKRCLEYALVLRAVGISCQVLALEEGFVLLVPARDAGRAQQQIALYRHENRGWPGRFMPRLKVYDGLNCAILYGLVILLVDVLQRHHAFSLDWWDAGKIQAGLIREGEWWRTLTALSLHADQLHLMGNLVFGALFGFLAGQLLGWGLAWSSMLLAGGLGNALTVLVRSPEHTSVGASTAVFAALGIVAAYTWKHQQRWINRWVPVGSGIALLGFLGMAGERTDIVAHLAGFGAGCLFGAGLGVLKSHVELAAHHQFALGLGALALFTGAWLQALLAHG